MQSPALERLHGFIMPARLELCIFVPLVICKRMDEIKEIVTRAGFVRVLTRRYEANQAAGTPQSMRAIFDDLEEEFENHYQQPLNWTYSGLKHYRQRYPDSWNQEPKQ